VWVAVFLVRLLGWGATTVVEVAVASGIGRREVVCLQGVYLQAAIGGAPHPLLLN